MAKKSLILGERENEQNKTGKITAIFVFLIILFLIALYYSCLCGYKEGGFEFLSKIISGDKKSILIFEFLRTPRVIKAIIAGSCLSLSGLYMQAITKNPLAEPYITGISSGAGLMMVLSLIYFNAQNYSLFGFLGAFFVSLIVILSANVNKFSIVKLILIGLSINIFASSLISLLILLNGDKAYPMMLILSGGVSNNSNVPISMLLTLFIIGLLLSIFAIPKLNLLRLDEKLSSSFYENTKLMTGAIIMLASFLASLSVFCAGIIGFVGIIVPLLSKLIIGEDYRFNFFINILLGSSLILISDYFARTLLYPLEIPLGLVLSFIGAPIFMFFLIKKGKFL